MTIDEVLEKLEITDERADILERKRNELCRLSSKIEEDITRLSAGDRKQIRISDRIATREKLKTFIMNEELSLKNDINELNVTLRKLLHEETVNNIINKEIQ